MEERDFERENEFRKKMSDEIRFFMDKLGFGDPNDSSEYNCDVSFHFTKDELGFRDRRDGIINFDDINNLKISLGLYENEKVSFDKFLSLI